MNIRRKERGFVSVWSSEEEDLFEKVRGKHWGKRSRGKGSSSSSSSNCSTTVECKKCQSSNLTPPRS